MSKKILEIGGMRDQKDGLTTVEIAGQLSARIHELDKPIGNGSEVARRLVQKGLRHDLRKLGEMKG